MKRILAVLALVSMVAVAPALACGGDCPGKMEGVKTTVVNTDNGAKILMVGNSPETVKAIQASTGGCPMSNAAKAEAGCAGAKCLWAKMDGVERKIENTDNGMVVLLTAANTEGVKKVQSLAAEMGNGKAGCSKSQGGCHKKNKTGQQAANRT